MCPTDFSDGHRFFYISNDSFVALRAEIFEKIFLRIIGACRLRNKFSNYRIESLTANYRKFANYSFLMEKTKITLSQKAPFSLHFDFSNLYFLEIKSSDGNLFVNSRKISSLATY